MAPLDRVLALVPPFLRSGTGPAPVRPFVLAIDGRSGSGKTELARAVAEIGRAHV